MWSAITVDIWQWTPLMFLILLSGLVALPEDQLNQARILGASFWHRFRYLMLPMMWPIILIAMIIRSIEVFKVFDAPFLLTRRRAGRRVDDDLDLDVPRGDHQLALGIRERGGDHRPDHRQLRRRSSRSGRSSRRRRRRWRS